METNSVTVNGKIVDVDIHESLNVYAGGYWLAYFSCLQDATTFIRQIEMEGRQYETYANNKLRIK